MSFEDDPKYLEETYPCQCDGTISKKDGFWVCDSCDFCKEETDNDNKRITK